VVKQTDRCGQSGVITGQWSPVNVCIAFVGGYVRLIEYD